MIYSSHSPLSRNTARRAVSASARKKPIPSGRAAQLFIPTLLIITVLVFHSLIGRQIPLQRWLFLSVFAAAAQFLPVTGPRGRRISLGDCVAMTSLLLLPIPLSLVPSLSAGALSFLSKQSRKTQNEALQTMASLEAAVLIGSLAFREWGAAVGLAAYVITSLAVKSGKRRVRRIDWEMQIATLACSVPTALLMAFLWPIWGLAGPLAAMLLLGLLLLVAHYAFETALLREQVRAMECVGAVALAHDNLSRLIERFLQFGGALVSSDRASLWMADDSRIYLDRVVRIRTIWNPAEAKKTQILSTGYAMVRFGEGLVGRVAERHLPLIVADVCHDMRAADLERKDWPNYPFSLLLLPLVVGGKTLGVVQFERDSDQHYSRRDLSRMRALVNQAATAISNAQQHRAITDQAVTDGLTGLFNRRYIQSALASEQRRALRYSHSLSVIMLDVDHFKSYNDTYGHTQGDVLIKIVAGLLRANIRAVDIVGRYGGEEFIVLMPETTKTEAAATAERLRLAVAEAAFPGFADDPEMAVLKTISLGVATLPEDAEDTNILVTRADQALYESKRHGRNRCTVAQTISS